MSTQHDTQLPHLLQKEPAAFVGEAGKKKSCDFTKYTSLKKFCPPRSGPADPGQGDSLFFLLSTGECAQKGGERSSGPSATAPQFQSRESQSASAIGSAAAQRRSQSGCRCANSLRQPVQRAEGLRDEGQESSARVSPVLPVWDRVLQERKRERDSS